MNTPLQELIDTLKGKHDTLPNDTKENRATKYAYVEVVILAKALLPREEEVIIMAHNDIDTHDSDDYYEEMYGNK